jgi:hypothetical protein
LPRSIYQPNTPKRFVLPQTFYIGDTHSQYIGGTRSQPLPLGVLSRELAAMLVIIIIIIAQTKHQTPNWCMRPQNDLNYQKLFKYNFR